ncbi:MAG: hypothetical protein ABSG69_13380 [Candidatus Acidiferrum sp.]
MASVEGRRIAALALTLGVAALAPLDEPVVDGFPVPLGAAADCDVICDVDRDVDCDVDCDVALEDAADIGEAIAATPKDGDGVCVAMDCTASGTLARKSGAAGAGEVPRDTAGRTATVAVDGGAMAAGARDGGAAGAGGAGVGRCGAAGFAGAADGGSAGTKVAVKAGGAIAAAKDFAGFAFFVALEFAGTLACAVSEVVGG